MLEKIELAATRTRADIAFLKARLDDAEKLRQDRVNSPPSIDGELELGALWTSLDEQAERSRHEFNAINKRID